MERIVKKKKEAENTRCVWRISAIAIWTRVDKVFL